MKKFKRFLTLLLALSMVMGMTAFAAAGDPGTIQEITGIDESTTTLPYADGDVSFDLTYLTGEPGGMYLILVLKDGAMDNNNPLDADDILYVNQATADDEGVVVFENVYPYVIEDGSIYVAGEDGLINLGTIIANLPNFVLGDVNGDGSINISDATEILRHIKKLTDLSNNPAADVVGGNGVDIFDANAILRHIKKIELIK